MSGFSSTTYSSLTDEIIGALQAWTAAPDTMTILLADLSATGTRIKVADVSAMARGVVEVGNELIQVQSVDLAAGELATYAAWRGFRGTTAETHGAGTTVTHAPAFPRSVVRREINSVLQSVYPSVYGVGALEVTGTTAPHVELPPGALRVVDVRAKADTLEGWVPVRQWGISHSAPSEYGTGVTLDLYGTVPAGTKVQVLYALAPSPFVNDTDPWPACGLPESCKDIVTFGVMYRLAQNLDMARLPAVSAEADQMTQSRPIGAASQVAGQFYKQHVTALQREQASLAMRYPARSHKVR